jgi:hypothetical protein
LIFIRLLKKWAHGAKEDAKKTSGFNAHEYIPPGAKALPVLRALSAGLNSLRKNPGFIPDSEKKQPAGAKALLIYWLNRPG